MAAIVTPAAKPEGGETHDPMETEVADLEPLGADTTPFPRKLYDIIMQTSDAVVAFSEAGTEFEVCAIQVTGHTWAPPRCV